MKSCFFIGHREASSELFPALMAAVERHITDYGVREFLVGNYGGFDRLAARAVMEAKKRHPEILLTLLLTYHPAERPVKVPPGFDGSFYPPGMETVPRRFAIVRANRYAVDHTDFLIAWAWRPAGNARDLWEYACRREKRGGIRVTLLKNGKPSGFSASVLTEAEESEMMGATDNGSPAGNDPAGGRESNGIQN